MQLSTTLSWLVDSAGETPGADRLLAQLGAHLLKDGLPLTRGALTLAVAHPLIARRTWLWRADSGEVIEGLAFALSAPAAAAKPGPSNDAGRRWLAGIANGVVHEDTVGPRPDGASLSWIGPRQFTRNEAEELTQAARFAAAPLAALAARATLTATLEAYLGRRSAARVLAAPLRRLRRRSAEIHRRRHAGDLSGRRGIAPQRLRCGVARGVRRSRRDDPSGRRAP
jgi:hypothetical protein